MADLNRIKQIIAERNKEKNKDDQIRNIFYDTDTRFPNMYKNFTTSQLETREKELGGDTEKSHDFLKLAATGFNPINKWNVDLLENLTNNNESDNNEYLNILRNERDYRKATTTERSTLNKIGNTLLGSIQETGANILNVVPTIINKVTGSDIDLIEPSYEQKLMDYDRLTSEGLEKVALDVTGSIGQQVIPALTSLTGVGSLPYAANFLNFGMGSYTDALKEGKTESQALTYGIVSGALETGLQGLLGSTLGNIYQKSGGSKLVNNVTKKIIKNDALRNYLSEMLSEGGEEYLQEILEPVVRNMTLGENNKFELFTEDALYAGILGSITAGIMNAPVSISNKINNVNPILTEMEKINYDNLTVDQAINALEVQKQVVENLDQTTENIERLQKIETLNQELNEFKATTAKTTSKVSDFKTDINTQIRSKQRALGQLESINPLLRTETQQNQINNLKNTIAELRKQEPTLTVKTSPTQNKMNKLKGSKNKNKDGYEYTVPTLYRGTNELNINKGVARFGEGTYYTPSEQRAKTYGEVTVYENLNNDFKNPYIQGTKYNDKMISLLGDYKTTHPDLGGKIDMVINNGMPLTNTIIPQSDIKQMYLDAGYDSFIGGTNNEPEYVSFKSKENTNNVTVKSPEQTINEAILDTLPTAPKPNEKLPEKLKNDLLRIVDKSFIVDAISEQTNNKKLAFDYFLMNTSNARTQFDIAEYQTDMTGKKIGKGLNEIFKDIEENELAHDFSVYMYAKHGIDRAKQGKPAFDEDITPEILEKFVKEQEQLHPEFKEYSKDVLNYVNNLRNIMVDAGLMSEEIRAKFEEMYPDYVRIYREKNNSAPYRIEGNTLKINSPIKTAKGGSAPIQPLKVALAKQTAEVKTAALRNEFGKSLAKSLKSEDSDIKNVVDNLITDNKNYGFIYYDNGKQKLIHINKDLYDAIKPSQKYDWENLAIFQAISKASKVQRSLLTEDNPVFAVTNFFKDMGEAGFNSKYGLSFYTKIGEAIEQIRTNGELWKLYKANGGFQSSVFDYNEGFLKIKKGFTNKIEGFNNLVEQIPRFMEFVATIENGGTIYEAMYNSMEITTNFNRGSDIVKALSRNGFNFLNASVQGLYKQYNNLRGANGVRGYAQLLTRAAVLGVIPSVLNHMLLGDDEDYQDLPTYVKDSYYLFKIGDDNFVKIPKARAMGILGNAARRVLSGESFEGFGKQAWEQVGVNNPLTNNIFAPIQAIKDNKSWLGYAIVPSRLEGLPPSEQYDAGTTELAKTIGKIFNISPMKIDYLIDQYSGVIGDITMPMMTEEADPNWLVGKFVVDAVMTNDNTNRLYEEIENLKKQKPTEDTKLQQKYLNSMLYYVNQYYSHIRAVQSDTTLSDSEKTEQVRALKSELNSLAKQTLELKDNIVEKKYKDTKYKQIGLQLYKYNKEDDEYVKVNTGTKTYRDILGYNVQQQAIKQEIDAEGKVYTKIGVNYYEVKEDGTYKKLTSSSAINKAKIKLGY